MEIWFKYRLVRRHEFIEVKIYRSSPQRMPERPNHLGLHRLDKPHNLHSNVCIVSILMYIIWLIHINSIYIYYTDYTWHTHNIYNMN
jgi:hypothetical protein